MSGKVVTQDVAPAASAPNIPRASRWKHWLTPAIILLMAAAIIVLITGNWNRWVGEHASQETDDAYLRADLTPLSTKVAGLVAAVAVSDYQPVKAGDLLVQLRDDDFRAQVQQAEAAVSSGKDALVQQSAPEGIAGRPHRSGRRRASTRRKRKSTPPRPELRRRNRRSPTRRAASTQPKRMWSAQDWSGGGRKRWSRRNPQRARSWSRQ